MKITRNKLRSFIIKELKESLTNWHSEVKYAKDPHSSGGRSRKRVQRGFNRAERAAAKGEIESQLIDLDPVNTDTIGDLLPISREEWELLSGTPGPDGVVSEKMAYLIDLAWDIASERITLAPDDLDILVKLAPEEFERQLTYAYDDQRVEEDMDDAFDVSSLADLSDVS